MVNECDAGLPLFRTHNTKPFIIFQLWCRHCQQLQPCSTTANEQATDLLACLYLQNSWQVHHQSYSWQSVCGCVLRLSKRWCKISVPSGLHGIEPLLKIFHSHSALQFQTSLPNSWEWVLLWPFQRWRKLSTQKPVELGRESKALPF